MKKLIKLTLAGMALATSALALTSCNNTKADYTIGVLQFGNFSALNDATSGFKAGFEAKLPKDKSVKFEVMNANQDTVAQQTMATKLVRDCDLVLGNATPCAQQLVSSREIEARMDLPLLFTSVTDPIAAGLVSETNRNNNVTGTSDINPVEQQLEMIFDVDPTVDKIGMIYNSSEVNSQAQANIARAYIEANYPSVDFEVKTFADVTSIGATTTNLVNDGCDCIYLPTDNSVAANVGTITNITNPKGVFTLAGEAGMVSDGATLTVSINYYELGKTTGEMAASILIDGKDPDTIEVGKQTELDKFTFSKNDQALQYCGITLSDEFKTKYGVN